MSVRVSQSPITSRPCRSNAAAALPSPRRWGSAVARRHWSSQQSDDGCLLPDARSGLQRHSHLGRGPSGLRGHTLVAVPRPRDEALRRLKLANQKFSSDDRIGS